MDALNAVIDRQKEGLVLKDPLSRYRPNVHCAGWAKVKSDHVDFLVDDLDQDYFTNKVCSAGKSGIPRDTRKICEDLSHRKILYGDLYAVI